MKVGTTEYKYDAPVVVERDRVDVDVQCQAVLFRDYTDLDSEELTKGHQQQKVVKAAGSNFATR